MNFNCDSFVSMNDYEFPEFPVLPFNLKTCVEKQELCVFSDNEYSSSGCTTVSQGTQTYILPSSSLKSVQACIFGEDGCDCKNNNKIEEQLSCNCTRNGCLKKYCVCRKAGVQCNHSCHCSGCENC